MNINTANAWKNLRRAFTLSVGTCLSAASSQSIATFDMFAPLGRFDKFGKLGKLNPSGPADSGGGVDPHEAVRALATFALGGEPAPERLTELDQFLGSLGGTVTEDRVKAMLCLIGAMPEGSKVTNDAKTVISAEDLKAQFDAVILTGGSEQSRDLPVPGRDLDGVHFAMEFLPQQNRENAGDKLKKQLRADGRHVVVIGGGDTGSDCVGTSNRHGAKTVTQYEVMPQPPGPWSPSSTELA